MNNAYCKLVNGVKKIITVDEIDNGTIKVTDIIKNSSYCPFCGATVNLRCPTLKVKHFYGTHLSSCPIKDFDKDGRYKVVKIKDNTIIDFNFMLKHKDKDPIEDILSPEETDDKDSTIIIAEDENGNINSTFECTTENRDDDCCFGPEDDYVGEIENHYIQVVSSVGSIYKYYLENGKDESYLGEQLKGSDVIINKQRMMTARIKGIDSEIKIVPMKKAVKKNLIYGSTIEVPEGYVLLQDLYSKDYERSIYFLIKLQNEKQNKKFQDLLFNKINTNTNKKLTTLLVAGKFKKVQNNYYQIYRCEINTKCFSFRRIYD